MSKNKEIVRDRYFDSAQNRQDEIFRKMSAEKKIKLASELTKFCFKLNRLNGNYKPRKFSS